MVFLEPGCTVVTPVCLKNISVSKHIIQTIKSASCRPAVTVIRQFFIFTRRNGYTGSRVTDKTVSLAGEILRRLQLLFKTHRDTELVFPKLFVEIRVNIKQCKPGIIMFRFGKIAPPQFFGCAIGPVPKNKIFVRLPIILMFVPKLNREVSFYRPYILNQRNIERDLRLCQKFFCLALSSHFRSGNIFRSVFRPASVGILGHRQCVGIMDVSIQPTAIERRGGLVSIVSHRSIVRNIQPIGHLIADIAS